MSPEQIRRELFKRRKAVTQASIARDLGVTRQAVIYTIDRKMKSQRIRAAIANAIGRDVSCVFDEPSNPACTQ